MNIKSDIVNVAYSQHKKSDFILPKLFYLEKVNSSPEHVIHYD